MSIEEKKVVFEIDNLTTPSYRYSPSTPWMVDLVYKLSGGRIKDEREANIVLITIVIVIFIITGVLFARAARNPVSLDESSQVIIPAGPSDPQFR